MVCDPLNEENSGCPELWQCKVDFDAPAAALEDLPTYCLPDLGGLNTEMPCTSSDECGGSMVCSPANNTCVRVCRFATDCIGGGTGFSCEKLNTTDGNSTYGYCKSAI